jgi:hypothetical protein
MPTWTISAPRDFQESVKETARKLGLGYGEYLRKAHRDYLGKLTSEDFERAKKLMELNESKERLGSLRERETVLLREKGYKDKNVQRIIKDVKDPEIIEEIERLARLREEEADRQLKLHEELNPTGKKQLGHPPKPVLGRPPKVIAPKESRCQHCGSTNVKKRDYAPEYLCLDCYKTTPVGGE